MLKTIIEDDFLTSDEVDYIAENVYSRGQRYDDLKNETLMSYYYTWGYYKKDFSDLYNIFQSKINSLFGDNLIVDHSHILHSFHPYTVHTDCKQDKIVPKNLTPAYTFIIPLKDYNSHTISFNQSATIKDISQWIEENNPPILNEINESEYEKYFTHIDKKFLKYLSIKDIFTWKKGSFHACDRRYFHCSDNYVANGINEKSAIIMWTSYKN